jgi:hypothetical protein
LTWFVPVALTPDEVAIVVFGDLHALFDAATSNIDVTHRAILDMAANRLRRDTKSLSDVLDGKKCG